MENGHKRSYKVMENHFQCSVHTLFCSQNDLHCPRNFVVLLEHNSHFGKSLNTFFLLGVKGEWSSCRVDG